MKDLLDGLNNEQKQAVSSKSQYMLVLAGAGTGKTQVLTKRIAYIMDLGVEPNSILSVTFTNKAAHEMKKRIKSLVNPDVNIDDIWIGTFHSICNRILREEPTASGLGRSFQIIDSDDQRSLVKQVIEEEKLFESFSAKDRSNKIKEAVKESINYINQKKDEIKRPKDCTFSDKDFSYYGFNILTVYKHYETKRQELEVLDFGDLMLYTVEMFLRSKETLKKYQDKFKHLLVDEFQDTNYIQYEWLKLLNKIKGNYLFVVGDDDQSIYGWRGANIKNILNFDQEFTNVETIRLEQNYRSTTTILDCANEVISNNKKRKGKNLWSAKEKGDPIEVYQANNPYSEAEYIARSIIRNINNGSNPSEHSILYRTNAVSRTIESKLNEFKIPYRIIGGVGFWSRMEIKDVMSYVAIILNNNNNIALERTINIPTRGIGKKTLEKIKAYSKANKINVLESLRQMLDSKEMNPATKAGKNLTEYLDLIDKGRNLINSPRALVEHIIYKTNIIKYYMNESEEKGSEREFNLLELINTAEHFDNKENADNVTEAFVNYASLQTDNNKKQDEDAVQMMTIHTAKGLEFPKVFLAGVEEGIFPSGRNKEGNKLEEERRLAYVGITRAERNLTITCSDSRFGSDASPSRFINELPENLIIKKIENDNNQRQNYSFLDKGNSHNSISKSFNQKRNFENLKIGSPFSHKKYGKGIILSLKEENDRMIIKINFDFYGIKNIMVTK